MDPFFPLDGYAEFSIDATLRDLKVAEFVLADLSMERPSCYFELGLAEATGTAVFVIATAGTPIHQVGNPCQIAMYSSLVQYRSIVSDILASFCSAEDRH
jgi:hypothetical protein